MTAASCFFVVFFQFVGIVFAGDEVEEANLVANISFWDDVYSAPGRLHPVAVRGFSRNFHGVDLNMLRSAIEKSFDGGPLQLPPVSGATALVLGCGDSGLPEELSSAGWQVTAVDQSKVIIDDMAARTGEAHSSINWVTADATSLASLTKGFHVAIEVALLDNLEANGEDPGMQQILSEAYGLLREDGALLSVSTQPPLFRGKLLQHQLPELWHVEPVRLPRAKTLDSRVAALDPAMSIGNLTLYMASKPLERVVEPLPQSLTTEPQIEAAEIEQTAENETTIDETAAQENVAGPSLGDGTVEAATVAGDGSVEASLGDGTVEASSDVAVGIIPPATAESESVELADPSTDVPAVDDITAVDLAADVPAAVDDAPTAADGAPSAFDDVPSAGADVQATS